jgi:hypothetical protein
MRCNNCGWDNPEGATQCQKCPNQLSKENTRQMAQNSSTFGKTIMGKQSLSVPTNPPKSQESVPIPVEKDIKNEIDSEDKVDFHCECGYPAVMPISTCPWCKKDLTPNNDKKSSDNFSSTIDPYRTPIIELDERTPVICRFHPIEREGEAPINFLEFHEDEALISLNRDNLEPLNPTISSSIQAELIFKEGGWFVTNKSSNETTFILLNEEYKLKDGDLLLIGNRKFKIEIL